MEAVRRFDKGLARGEAAIAATVLLLMIGIAAAQAVLRNLTYFDVGFANEALSHMAWVDSFLQKGTLWLAFFGASLATHDEKHIAIDVLQRLAKPKARNLMRSIVSLFSGITCFYLARVFWMSVLNNAQEVPLEYSMLGVGDVLIHICEASPELIHQAEMSRPDIFCGIRSMIDVFGASMSTPDTAFQLVVPAMFMFIAARFILRAIASFLTFAIGKYQKEGLSHG